MTTDLRLPPVWCDRTDAEARRARIAAAVRGKRVAVLMGGDTGEREVSLRSGAGVAGALASALEAEVEAVDIRYDKLTSLRLDERFDVAYNVLHGGRGEDGTIQGYLDCVGLPYTGPGVLGCSTSMDKVVASRLLAHVGVAVPEWRWVTPETATGDTIAAACAELGLPLVAKPRSEGSSLGVYFCHTEAEAAAAVAELTAAWGGALLCRMVPEPEVTVGVVHGWPMGVLELRAKREFYDYTAKYTKGLTEFIIPARLEERTFDRTLETAVRAAEALECSALCRVDMRIDADGTPQVLDVNASPGMTETSDLPQGASYLGMSYAELTVEVLGGALVRAGLLAASEWEAPR